MVHIYNYQSPLGDITLAGNERALTGLWFEGQKYFGSTLPEGSEPGELPVFLQTKRWLDLYFAGEIPDFMPPLEPQGSPFRKKVWEIMLGIAYGQTMTYGDIARRMADWLGVPTMSAQAVGGAVAHNPISILIPCHRVVGTGGSLTGYAGGIEKKIALLKLEENHVGDYNAGNRPCDGDRML